MPFYVAVLWYFTEIQNLFRPGIQLPEKMVFSCTGPATSLRGLRKNISEIQVWLFWGFLCLFFFLIGTELRPLKKVI